ncbi:UPF0319 protein [Vibrio nigripulchritudo]|uniref:YccT family protein n=1 Tax=Vibrio nigripulchritudo TaxID=28173 RepID=UPI00190D28F1|nr:DUF2057 domain-containing protein [Vibrio nigripulchritudo]BCL68862.1 UPF0319 protein [Vibrio nigripulchritudo]BDU30193.1 UPF0319 protein [Vibrio nigripulchritudo]
MKLLYKVLTASAVLLSLQAQADVKVNLHRDLAPVVVDGEEVGFSLGKKSQLVLKNGKNQIVVRVSKLVAKQGEHEKFNSEPMVVTFEASNTELTLNPTRVITRIEQVGSFEDNPEVEMFDKNGRSYTIEQGLLKRGSGLTRDYERELAKFNQKNGIEIAAVAAASNTVSTPKNAKISSNKHSSTTLSGLKSDFTKLTAEEKKEFLMWAVGQ